MINYNRLGYEIKRDFTNFSLTISRGSKRPQEKFIHQMIFGILAANKLRPSEIALFLILSFWCFQKPTDWYLGQLYLLSGCNLRKLQWIISLSIAFNYFSSLIMHYMKTWKFVIFSDIITTMRLSVYFK